MSFGLTFVITILVLSFLLIFTRATTLIEKGLLFIGGALVVYGYMHWPWF